MAWNDDPQRARDGLDDAIDRVVREMTRADVGDHDEAVARIMARVRGAKDAPLRPRAAWMSPFASPAAWALAGAAVLLIAVVAGFLMRMGGTPDDARGVPPANTSATSAGTSAPTPAAGTAQEGVRAEANAPRGTETPNAAGKPMTAGDKPMNAGGKPMDVGGESMRATALVEPVGSAIAATRAVDATGLGEASGLVRAASDVAADAQRSDLLPPETDIAVAGIEPAPLSAPAELSLAPLDTRTLVVESIDPRPITVPPPVGPQR